MGKEKKIEKYTEQLVLKNMKVELGKNSFGYIFPQGDVGNFEKIEKLLKKAGGKPEKCEIEEYPVNKTTKKGQPEFIITFNDEPNTIIVVECKKDIKNHKSEDFNRPKQYAVDGVLYYAKFLKEMFNVYAIAVSGTEDKKNRVTTFFWPKEGTTYSKIEKFTDSILEPLNYIRHLKGEKIKKEFSLSNVRKIALELHDALREIKIIERQKPIFIAGILIALEDEDFLKNYNDIKSYKALMVLLKDAIERKLKKSNVSMEKIQNLINAFQDLNSNVKLPYIELGETGSIKWYIEKLEINIKPMLNHSETMVDALGVFYHEFIKYSGGDGKGLGIVLTPEHLTDFMCDLAKINKNTKVLDICCGSAGFLVTAMSKMLKNTTSEEAKRIKEENLYGIEQELELYTLAVTNMILRKDGKSNIFQEDCFNKEKTDFLKNKKIDVGIINPPYSQTDYSELEFVERLLEFLTKRGIAIVVVPMSCAIGTKYKEVRERLFKNHTLKAVFSMPDEIFYPISSPACVMVWEAHQPHDKNQKTFFGYYKKDGFEKRKKLGRIDVNNTWNSIKNEWLELYFNNEEVEGKTCKKNISHDDEWLAEAYMQTDYSNLNEDDFINTVQRYLSYKVYNYKDLSLKPKFLSKGEKEILKIEKWKSFKIENLFFVTGSKTTPKIEVQSYGVGEYPYVTTQAVNNGVENFYNFYSDKGNVLTIDSAVIGYCSYQGLNFSASDHVEKLNLKKHELNLYIGLFLSTIINQEQFRYCYGRKFSQKRIKKTIIKLPAKLNEKNEYEPDWEFMENYIKSLPYGNII